MRARKNACCSEVTESNRRLPLSSRAELQDHIFCGRISDILYTEAFIYRLYFDSPLAIRRRLSIIKIG
ncbi:hypothetical protein AQJ84_20420 [Streptomyces resistomycificus]|nr:hypothetical protein AQJ84_20420 [Streptomyces resistomycificus]